ncbi:MAG: hypothetical protein RR212_12865 [Bacteroidales bacterium]
MKKVVLFLALAAGFALASCGGKKTETNPAATDSIPADTIVMDYGTVEVDSVSPDSAEVTVMDTAVEMIAEPEGAKANKK